MKKTNYRTSEKCPICGKRMKHYPSYREDIGGAPCEVEYGLECETCGTIDYFSYGRWEGDIVSLNMEEIHE